MQKGNSLGRNSSASIVDRVYKELKSRAVNYALKPGSRLNEGEIARSLGVSRTPLREAMNRLTSDGFLEFSPHQGFFRKRLDAREIFELYELRRTIEVAAARLASCRARGEQFDELEAFLSLSAQAAETEPIDKLVSFDEGFHDRIVQMTGNAAMLAALQNINERIRFVRWIDMENNRRSTQKEHVAILEALRAGNGDTAAALLDHHIDRRMDQIIAQVREGYARIYVEDSQSQEMKKLFA